MIDEDPKRIRNRLSARLLLLHFLDDVPFFGSDWPGQCTLEELMRQSFKRCLRCGKRSRTIDNACLNSGCREPVQCSCQAFRTWSVIRDTSIALAAIKGIQGCTCHPVIELSLRSIWNGWIFAPGYVRDEVIEHFSG
jgi:hypothetical protein